MLFLIVSFYNFEKIFLFVQKAAIMLNDASSKMIHLIFLHGIVRNRHVNTLEQQKSNKVSAERQKLNFDS